MNCIKSNHLAVQSSSWGSLQWLAGKGQNNSVGLTLGRVVIKAGHENPRHAHRNCEEILYLEKGELCHSVENDTVVMNPGDVLSVPAGLFHNARSIGADDAVMIVAYTSAERDFVLEPGEAQ